VLDWLLLARRMPTDELRQKTSAAGKAMYALLVKDASIPEDVEANTFLENLLNTARTRLGQKSDEYRVAEGLATGLAQKVTSARRK